MGKRKNEDPEVDQGEVSGGVNEQALETFLLAAMMQVQNPNLDINLHELAHAVYSTPSNIPDTIEVVYSTPNGPVTEVYNTESKKG